MAVQLDVEVLNPVVAAPLRNVCAQNVVNVASTPPQGPSFDLNNRFESAMDINISPIRSVHSSATVSASGSLNLSNWSSIPQMSTGTANAMQAILCELDAEEEKEALQNANEEQRKAD